MSDRPMVNVYEGDPEVLVYRPMNDAELAQYEADQAEHAEIAAARESPAPSVEEKLIGALEALPADKTVTASDLLAILRPDTMAAADALAPSDHPAAGA